MKTTALITIFCGLAVVPIRAGTIAVDPTSGSGGLVSGNGGLTLGWEFQVNNTDGIVVDGLGFWDYQSDGFLFSQTFPVGLWDASSGTLLRSSVISSASPLRVSLDPEGSWRVNSVAPLYLPPGLYRIGGLMPVSGANQIISFGATVQSAPEVNVVRYLRQLGSATLAMPDIPGPVVDSSYFGPTFTFAVGPLAPTGSVVAPEAYTSISGTTGLNTLVRNSGASRAYQMQYSAAALGALPVGATITELRFRLQISELAAFPPSTTTWPEYQVTLAQATRSIASMSTTFAVNMFAPVVVKSGALTVGPGTFPAGGNPNAFGALVVLDTPYVYKGGDLVMFFRHTGSDSASTAFLDAISASTIGYGTDFRALSATTSTNTVGIQASATIVQIVFTYSPSESAFADGTNLVIVGKGGPPGESYRILASTNVNAPMSQWTPIETNLFDGSGGFHYTNGIDGISPARFFRFAFP